jgi:hypothetical protein
VKIAGIEFPEPLLAGLREGNLVIFAGAGVSIGPPANLPDFRRLAEQIADGTGEVIQDREPEDRFLGRLRFDGVDVHTRAARILSRGEPSPTDLHRDLLRLYPSIGQVRIVTTNFDQLFERTVEEIQDSPDVFVAPALPLGDRFNGIVHIHGAVSRPGEMVLTDSDFGRAYLTEGWARRFLVNVFRHFTVLFVGYRHNDIIVNYLARALPESEIGKRYVLTGPSDDRQKWEVLGIEPIVYSKSTDADHRALYEGVRRWADTVRRGTLDWQHEITEIAAKPPPIGTEEEDIIKYALADPVTTRFFVDAARSPEWIQWLDERKHLEPLFNSDEFQECHGMLAFWLGEHYAISNAEELFLLIGKHGTRLSPRFWWELGRDIFARYQPPIDRKILSRWVSLLITTAPPTPDHHVLLWMGQRCAKEGVLPSLLQVFDFMTRSSLVVRKSFVHMPAGESSGDRVEVTVTSVADEYALDTLWSSAIKPNLPGLAITLMNIGVGRLQERYSIWASWQRANHDFDLDSWGRSAIEPHEQDSRRKAVDALVDAARDCLEYFVSQPAYIANSISWCDQLSASEVPLLRRLAVHTLALRQDLSAEHKLHWLIQFGLHDGPVRHELFRAVQSVYSQASPEARAKTIEAIFAYRWPNEADQDNERRAARRQYDWLQYLHMAAPDCSLTTQALDKILAKYPEFKPSDNPDMSHWMTGGWIGPRSPWTADELLGRRPIEWLHELLSFQATDVLGADRHGLISTITEAAKRDTTWGLELADSLATAGEWATDLWQGLFDTWRTVKLEESQDRHVLLFLNRRELRPIRYREIADVLCEWAKKEDKSLSLDMLSEVNAAACSLWQEIDGTEMPIESNDWLLLAINSAPGMLAQFWLHSLSRWRKNQNPTPDALNDEYRSALSTIVLDQTLAGRLGRCLLCSQLAFLLVADEDWTKQHLLPGFILADNIAEFQAAWDGFLCWGHLNPTVAKLLELGFLKAVRHIGTTRDRRERFTEYYASMVIYFVTDPLAVWIPEFFDYGTVEMRHHFTWAIGRQLQAMDEKRQTDLWHRWLRRYWENRLQGVPRPFDDREIEATLDWIPHLKNVFPEAVELAQQMRSVELQHGSVIYQLARVDIPAAHNESLARLLLSLGRNISHHIIWMDGRTLIDRLLGTEISSALKQELRELAARLGL